MGWGVGGGTCPFTTEDNIIIDPSCWQESAYITGPFSYCKDL